MASSRRTLDIDLITLNTINIRGDQNTIIPSNSVLISDGTGGTYWSIVSTVGTYPSFQRINIDSNSYSATPTSQAFSFLTGNGIGFADAGPGSNATYLYAKAFQTIAVQGNPSLTAFTSNTLTPTLTLSSLGGLQISTDTTHQVIYFDAGMKNFRIVPNTSTFTSSLTGLTPTIYPITPKLSTLTFIGVGDITLTPDSQTNAVFVGLQGFTSKGYQDLSGRVFTLQSTILTNASTNYVQIKDFYSTISSFSSIIGHQISSYQISSTYLALSTFSMSNISTYSTLYSSLSTTVSFNISTLSSYFYGVNQSTLSTFIYNSLTSTVIGYSNIYSTITFDNITYTLSTMSTFAFIASTNASTLVSTTRVLSNVLNSTIASTFFLTSSVLVSTLYYTAQALSSMSTTMTSTFLKYFTPRLNLVSSLGYRGARGDGVPYWNFTNGAPGTGDGVLFSTASFNFSNLSNVITSKTVYVSIDYSPTILFPMGVSATLAPQYISTYIAYQPVNDTYLNYITNVIPIPSTTYTDMVQLNQYNAGNAATTSNLYSKFMRLTINPKNLIDVNFTGNYVIYHYLPNAWPSLTNTPYLAGTTTGTLHIRTSAQNSIFINIFNMS